MEEKELKTSPKQRIFISIIAIIMLASIIASYAAIIAGGSSSSDSKSKVDEAKIAEYTALYEEKQGKLKELSSDNFAKFIGFKSEIAAYNETSANENGLKMRDLLEGSGKTITSEDSDYLAYYVGWCADETVFDSTLDDPANPTGFVSALAGSPNMIEGWKQGINGMKLGGIRKITIPGELAYGETTEICGGFNKPLKFIVMLIANDGEIGTAAAEAQEVYMRLQYASYGLDYDEYVNQENASN